jgi:GTP pyrophosphokinase
LPRWRTRASAASGEPFLDTLPGALILASSAQAPPQAALHDVPEDTTYTLKRVEEKFGGRGEAGGQGDQAGQARLPAHGGRRSAAGWQAENLRKMLVAMAEAPGGGVHQACRQAAQYRTLDALPPKSRRPWRAKRWRYMPLAHRLGITGLKWQLEDLGFRLEPENTATSPSSWRQAQRAPSLVAAMIARQDEYEKAGIKAEVTGRPSTSTPSSRK